MSIFERLLDNSNKILDRIQAAEYLGVDPHTLQNRGWLPVIRLMANRKREKNESYN